MGLYTGADQDHLGCVSTESPARGVFTPGVRTENRDETQVSRGFCGDRGGAGSMVTGEGGGVPSFGGHHGRGGRKAPADRLHGPIEIPPE